MYNRVYRYDKPTEEVLLDILNYTNKTAYEYRQLSFGPPLALGDTLTQLVISPTDNVSWQKNALVKYNRLNLGETFELTPLVIDVPDQEITTILKALKDQCRVLFAPDEVTLTQDTSELASVLTHTVLAASAEDAAEPVVNDQVFNYRLSADFGNLIWVGETPVFVRQTQELMGRDIRTDLAIRHYFAETRSRKVAIELIVDATKTADDFAALLKKFNAGGKLNAPTHFTPVAKFLTGDEWVSVKERAPFNLYEARVLYNGLNSGEYFTGQRKHSHVLALELSEACTNLSGIWLIPYRDATAYRYSDYRIDHGPLLDQ